MSRLRILIALGLSYALLGILMNSIGTVILQSIHHFGATKPMGSTLEACKDLSVVVASFLFAVRIPAFGYRRALGGVMAAIAIACITASFAASFIAMQLLFVATGLCFGIAKVATYGTIGLLARDPADHASTTATIEGVFMVGLLAGVWLFGWFIGADRTGDQWLHVYWLLGGIAACLALLWSMTPIDETGAIAHEADLPGGLRAMLALAALPATVAFLAGIFCYVLVEQSVGTWLPTFNNEILHLPPAMSVQMSSIFVGALAVGRLASGVVLRRIHWLPVLLACLAGIAILVVATLPATRGLAMRPDIGWANAPVAAYVFPLLGIFMAPIYPTLCSVVLSALPRHRHAAMMGLIVIFSALGGTLGSFVTSLLFQHVSGQIAFYFTLVPLALIAMTLFRIRSGLTHGVAA
ncbi:MFS transporter [Sphingomonas sp. So64.6b]|uniref:MFS transporter n=1 Tax=Sphingomonas sp. So64.6b TaxID=2997354 RepID=UPI0016034CF9|nr:MFS transporter [Sphingomonas sp. So64.6b]QNA85389.1 MFS transporter [Sphingomonas sp. So64.6b]